MMLRDLFDRRRSTDVEGLDSLHAPGLAFLALFFSSADRLPIS